MQIPTYACFNTLLTVGYLHLDLLYYIWIDWNNTIAQPMKGKHRWTYTSGKIEIEKVALRATESIYLVSSSSGYIFPFIRQNLNF